MLLAAACSRLSGSSTRPPSVPARLPSHRRRKARAFSRRRLRVDPARPRAPPAASVLARRLYWGIKADLLNRSSFVETYGWIFSKYKCEYAWWVRFVAARVITAVML